MKHRGVRLLARSLGLITVLVYFLGAVISVQAASSIAHVMVGFILWGMATTGFVTAWFSEGAGGAIIIVVAFMIGITLPAIEENVGLEGALVVAGPWFLVGALFVSCRQKKPQQES